MTTTKTTLTAREVSRVFRISRDTAYGNVEALGGFRLGRRVMFPVGRVAVVLGISTEELLRIVGNGNGSNGA